MATNKRIGSYKLNHIVHKLTAKVYGKYGFLNGTIIQDWPKIVGAEYTQSIAPEKITFPPGKKNHGTLVVKASSHSTALIFQHIQTYVIDRINTYYGYKAIDKIKIVVGALPKIDQVKETPIAAEKPLEEIQEKSIEKMVENIDNQDLKDSLKNLGRQILRDAIETNNKKT